MRPVKSSPLSNKQYTQHADREKFVQPENLSEVVVLLPSALSESFEIVLARVLDLRKRKIHVKVLFCDGLVKGCVVNPFGINATCRHCRRVRDIALKEILPECKGVSLDARFTSAKRDLSDLSIETERELLNGVESTILTFYRRDVNRLSKKFLLHGWIYRSLLRRYMRHSEFVYSMVKNFIQENSIERIEFFNGRIVPTRAIMRAARELSVNFSVIEVSGQEREIFTAENESVHDFHYNQKSLKDFISAGFVDAKLGAAFFESRKNGLETDARSFIRRQKLGALSSNDLRPVLAIFTSSADELQVAGAQWFTSASIEPIPFILKIADLLGNQFRIIVRMHPNQAGDRTGAACFMQQALSRHPDIELIKPDDVQSTYELIDVAEVVLTFGSTVGLEATYWGKPSILCGRAVWDQLDIAYSAETSDDVKLLLSKNLVPRSKSEAIEAGSYYMVGRGSKGTLSWQKNSTIGFSVDGHNFLSVKRSGIGYWMARMIDKSLRLI